MRRSKRPDGEAREALLTAAERLLGQRSLAELTVADLLGEAEVSRASFYFYFGSKTDVVVALAERVIEEIDDAARPWLERGDLPPDEALRVSIGGLFAAWGRHGPVLRTIAESWHASPELGELWGGVIARFTQAAHQQLERERASGEAPEDGRDTAALAAALVWMNERVLYLWATGAEPALADADVVADTLTSIWSAAVYRR